jgi:5'-phosphate synthase pdxT subunit
VDGKGWKLKRLHIGVLSLQGAFREHIQILRRLGAEASEVRLPQQLHGLSGLIIPGGESTTVGKLAVTYRLMDPLREFAAAHPVWGTCAGLIFLAKKTDCSQPLLEVMDVFVKRNAFGRQVDSFETDLFVPMLENGAAEPFHAVFIRAPYITSVRGNASVIAKLSNGTAVAVREGKWLGTAFHPELTSDFRFHRYFLQMTKDNQSV